MPISVRIPSWKPSCIACGVNDRRTLQERALSMTFRICERSIWGERLQGSFASLYCVLGRVTHDFTQYNEWRGGGITALAIRKSQESSEITLSIPTCVLSCPPAFPDKDASIDLRILRRNSPGRKKDRRAGAGGSREGDCMWRVSAIGDSPGPILDKVQSREYIPASWLLHAYTTSELGNSDVAYS